MNNNLFDKGKIKDATKLEVCVYIVKAMDKEEEAKGRPSIFAFEDANTIPVDARPYVKFLMEKKIIDEKGGDGQNKFNPNQPVTRAVLAKMLSLTYDEISGDTTPPKDNKEKPIVNIGVL